MHLIHKTVDFSRKIHSSRCLWRGNWVSGLGRGFPFSPSVLFEVFLCITYVKYTNAKIENENKSMVMEASNMPKYVLGGMKGN